MKETIKPGFFIVGAPKSGTTSLYFYLKKHPQIYLPRIKELNFFCTDLHFRFPLLDEQQFLAYYRDYKNEKVAGAVSVWDLYSAAAAQNIYQFNPDSKIIILLRNPVEMMYALHSNHVFNDNETISDFETALNVQYDRKSGLRISPDIKCPVEALYYYDVAAYALQVKRYLALFGTDQVRVILFDDFIARTKEVYNGLLKFLEVKEVLPDEFEVFNASKTTRSGLLKKVMVHSPPWARRIGQLIFPHQTARRDWLMFWLWKINTREVKRPPMDQGLRARIAAIMKEDIDALEILLGRDLSHWR